MVGVIVQVFAPDNEAFRSALDTFGPGGQRLLWADFLAMPSLPSILRFHFVAGAQTPPASIFVSSCVAGVLHALSSALAAAVLL